MENLKTSSDVLFILLGAVLVLAMHAGFAFLELGNAEDEFKGADLAIHNISSTAERETNW